MARITLFLLLLLLRNNAYAYCYATQWTDYGPVFSSLGVAQGTTLQACQQLACQLYPGIPECSQPVDPPCQDITDFQSLACQPNHSGAINQSRTKTCSNNQWTDWTTTSNNCTPDPPTCIESVETRQLTCSPGFEGLSQEQRTSICLDPYGSPTWTTWSEIYNTCKMTSTNLNNPASPISPISPTNPNSVLNQVTTAPIIQPEPVIVQDMTALTTTVTETPATSVATVKSESSGGTSAPSPASTTTTSGTDKKDNIKAPETPKGKDLVPGFGIVMSMQLLNAGYNMQQAQLEESIKLIQEEEYGRQQNILLEFISANDTGDYIIRASANRWRSILRDNPLQRFDLDD
jgi:hypothetical protein